MVSGYMLLERDRELCRLAGIARDRKKQTLYSDSAQRYWQHYVNVCMERLYARPEYIGRSKVTGAR